MVAPSVDQDVVLNADCPSRVIMDQLADRWSMLVLAVLQSGPQRFNATARRLDGVTHRVLAQTLRRLERNGMVHRRVLPGSPPGVEYSLTPLGNSLQEPFSVLNTWMSQNVDEVISAQQDYDDNEEIRDGAR